MTSPPSLTSHQRPSESFRNPIAKDVIKDSSAPPTPPRSAEELYNPGSIKFWLIILSMYISFFLVALDRMIIATAIPSITNTFDSISDIAWYGSAYMLTCAIFNPLFGKVYQLYSTKWTFIVCICIFEIGSAVCGAASNSDAFIVGRAIAGIGAAGIQSGAIMIIVPLVPLDKRPLFTSFFGMAFAVSSVLGPLIGGLFTDSAKLTWRWCFYINLPIGAFSLAVVLLCLKLPSKPREKLSVLAHIKRLDPLGLFFLIPSMVSLILALQWGGSTDTWSAPRIIGLLVIFVVTFISFITVEFKFSETAMAPPRVVLNRSVGSSMVFVFLLMGGMMNLVYYISIWFQAAQRQSAKDAGIRTIPLVLALVVTGIFGAVLTQKIGYYVPAMLVSPILAAVGAGMLSTLTPTASSAEWIGFQVLYGLGVGAGAQTANLAPQTVLSKADVPLGMAMMFFTQQLGGAIFLAVGQNLFSNELVRKLVGFAGLDAMTIINTGTTDLLKIVSDSDVSTVVNGTSYALTRTFVLSAALSAGMILAALAMEWRSIKKVDEEANKKTEGDAEKAER